MAHGVKKLLTASFLCTEGPAKIPCLQTIHRSHTDCRLGQPLEIIPPPPGKRCTISKRLVLGLGQYFSGKPHFPEKQWGNPHGTDRYFEKGSLILNRGGIVIETPGISHRSGGEIKPALQVIGNTAGKNRTVQPDVMREQGRSDLGKRLQTPSASPEGENRISGKTCQQRFRGTNHGGDFRSGKIVQFISTGVKPPLFAIIVAIQPMRVQVQLDVVALCFEPNQLAADSIQIALQLWKPRSLLRQPLEIQGIDKERQVRTMSASDLCRFFGWLNQTTFNSPCCSPEEQFIIKAQQNLEAHMAPFRSRTTGMVFNRIIKSKLSDQVSMYSKSSSSHLLKGRLLRPEICQIQVMPGLTLNRFR